MKSGKKGRIAIDMDEVLANANARFIEWYARDTGIEVKEEDLYAAGKKFYQYIPDLKIRDYLFEPGFFKNLPVIPNSQKVVKWLSENYEIFIVTAAIEFRNSLADKHDWLHQHFPFLDWRNFVFCGRKDMIIADYLIDDHVKNLEPFTGTGILYHAPHNLHENRFHRVKNWLDISTFFETELEKI